MSAPKRSLVGTAVATIKSWWSWLLCWLFGACGPQVVLLRHADYDPGPGDPDLNNAGQARRDQLAQVLAKTGISHIVVSELARSQQTAATLATDVGLTPEVIGATDLDAIEAAVRARPSTVVVIGHSNTVPLLIERFTGSQGPPIGSEFDDLFLVIRRRLIHLQYGAPT